MKRPPKTLSEVYHNADEPKSPALQKQLSDNADAVAAKRALSGESSQASSSGAKPIGAQLGVLTEVELALLTPEQQLELDQTMVRLIGRYGEEAVRRERDRHRRELRLAYGF